MNSSQTLMIDLMPGQGSSITACVSSFFSFSHILLLIHESDRTTLCGALWVLHWFLSFSLFLMVSA